MASPAKKRKMNFSEREVEILIEEIEKQKRTLVNHFNAGVSHVAKNNAWVNILKRVNAVTTCPRELTEVKKKWSDLKTEVRRKVAHARVAVEGSSDCKPVPVVLTPMQQRICNLLGEATIVSLPAGDAAAEITLPVSTVTITQSIETAVAEACEEQKVLEAAETTYHTLEDGGVVEYCTTETPPVEVLSLTAESSAKPHELRSRVALNSARLLQEQKVTNLHVREIAQRLENQNDLLQMVRRSQEAQACAQERQAQALEGMQAALLALVQMVRPALKDLRKVLQGGTGGLGAPSEEVKQQPNGQQKVEDVY